MKRLIEDAAKLSDTVDAQDMSFANIVKAINVVQTEMGITGTTAKEAASTISGSVKMMKSAWTNLVRGVADENADFDKLMDNFVDSVAIAGKNILPRVQKALEGAATLISKFAPVVIAELPGLMEKILPGLTSATADLIINLAKQIPSLVGSLIDAAREVVSQIGDVFAKKIPSLSGLFRDLEVIVGAVAAAFLSLKASMAISAVVDALTKSWLAYKAASEGATISQWLLNGAMNANPIALIISLLTGVVTALMLLWSTNDGFKNSLINSWQWIANVAKIVWKEVAYFFTTMIPDAFNSVMEWFKDVGKWFEDIGKNIVNGVKRGLQNAWRSFKDWFNRLFKDLIDGAKDILGIRSPSRVFRDQIGKQMAAGVGVGWEDEFGKVKSDIEDSLGFDNASIGINASIRKVGAETAGMAYGGTSIGNITINIDGAKYYNEESLAYAVAEAIQDMTERKAAVYA